MVSAVQDAERSLPAPRKARETTPRPQATVKSRVGVRFGRVQGFSLGLARQVAPIWPAGHAIAWTLSLGFVQLRWGWVR